MRKSVFAVMLLFATGFASAEDAPAPATAADEAAPATAETAAMPAAELARAQFSSAIQDREPVDNLADYTMSDTPLYFFTDIRDGAGQTVTHRWLLDGAVLAEVPFNVGGNRWRVWSSKNFVPEWAGNWVVQVVDAGGNVLVEKSVRVATAAVDVATEPAQ